MCVIFATSWDLSCAKYVQHVGLHPGPPCARCKPKSLCKQMPWSDLLSALLLLASLLWVLLCCFSCATAYWRSPNPWIRVRKQGVAGCGSVASGPVRLLQNLPPNTERANAFVSRVLAWIYLNGACPVSFGRQWSGSPSWWWATCWSHTSPILFAHDPDLIHVSGRLLLLHHFSEEFSVGEPTGISGHKQVARFDKRLMFPWLSKSIRDSETHLPG